MNITRKNQYFKSFLLLSSGVGFSNCRLLRCMSNRVVYDYHTPVMIQECLEHLNVQPGRLYVDCTLGGGGHSHAILERGGLVIGIDQDPQALEKAASVCKLYIEKGQMELHRVNFRQTAHAVLNCSTLLAARRTNSFDDKSSLVDGVLMDLGISSHQIDCAARGFAFGQEGPLDMRMCQVVENSSAKFAETAITAKDIVNEWDVDRIANLLYEFGDETNSRAIAKQILLHRPLKTTLDLEKVISGVTPWKRRNATLARCFQAIRIVVNDEMSALDEALEQAASYVRPGGRLAVLSYHSLEDRKVKHMIRGSSSMTQGNDDRASFTTSSKAKTLSETTWKAVFKKALTPTEAEIVANHRARSAKLRVAERCGMCTELSKGVQT